MTREAWLALVGGEDAAPEDLALIAALARLGRRRAPLRALAEEALRGGRYADAPDAAEDVQDAGLRLAAADPERTLPARYRQEETGTQILLAYNAQGASVARLERGPEGCALQMGDAWVPLPPGQDVHWPELEGAPVTLTLRDHQGTHHTLQRRR